MQRRSYGLLALFAASSGAFGLAPALAQRAAIAAPESSSLSNDELQIVAADSMPIPGMIEVPAGRAWIGSTEKEIEGLLAQTPGWTRILDAQTPQHQVDLPAFWLGRYEVTNGEYQAFVEATGHQPPIHWVDPKAENAAMLAFAKEENDKFEAAKAEGRAYERKKWAADESPNPRDRWWAASWREIGYRIPEGLERYPVVFVTYDDVQAYCSWAGMRLPTEFEFQRAARKDSKSVYPWGDAWEDGKYGNTNELRRAKPHTVGSFEAGVGPFGHHDLGGNVWEWTSSPYSPYKNFKQGSYRVRVNNKPETYSVPPQWDPNQRVVVGGAYEVDKIAARVATRRGTARSQFTGAMGFRLAASSRVGLDKASLLIEVALRNAPGRADGAVYAPEGVVALDRWHVGAPGIVGYDYVLFLPVEEVTPSIKSDMELASRTAPVQLGVFSSNIDMLEPELPAGTYFVSYRGKGKPPRPTAADKGKDKDAPDGQEPADGGGKQEGEGQEAAPTVDPLLADLDLEQPWLLFVRLDGTRAAAVTPQDLSWGKGNWGGAFKIRTGTERIGSGANAVVEPRTFLDLEVGLKGKLRGQALPLKVTLRPSDAALGKPWRQ